MNQKERKIIQHLREDARTSLAAMSASVDMPISTIYDKITKFHSDQTITRYTTLIDFRKVGLHYNGILHLKVKRYDHHHLLKHLQHIPGVNSLFEVAGGFIIETLHANVKEYLYFLENLTETFAVEVIEHQVIDSVFREKCH